ncbi:MAG: dienelactone hydrolase family protein, partial [Planctomycetaceae bacterium]|nr:dienelactone hydrolase family protein [Planctomycetaceae bacterium]
LAAKERPKLWNRDLSSPGAYAKSIAGKQTELSNMLGMTDPLVAGRISYIGDAASQPSSEFTLYEVSWPTLDDMQGTGLLLIPEGAIRGDIVAIPEADQIPEDLVYAKNPADAYARQLVRSGFRVLIPTLINRETNQWKMSNREWAHRPSFELGRTLAGYETQKVLAGVSILKQTSQDEKRPLGVIGWGEGGRLALYAAALDPRIDAAAVCGYFSSRQFLWEEPADRNVFGLLKVFGDAEIASLVAPRTLIIESGKYPEFGFRTTAWGELEVKQDGYAPLKGKPGRLLVPDKDEVKTEVARAREFTAALKPQAPTLTLVDSQVPVSQETLTAFVKSLAPDAKLAEPYQTPELKSREQANKRHDEQLAEILRHNQRLLQLAYETRIEFMKDLKTDSLENFEKSVEPYRKIFRDEVIGSFDLALLPDNARSRKYQVGPKTISYEVEMDVFPEVTAYGILTLPKDMKLDGSEQRPVVVCQHGLEGRPQHTVGEEGYRAYKSFATHLAERGFITFAPQNAYVLLDRFRTLQFKSQSIGRSVFSIAVPKHQQITNWLST